MPHHLLADCRTLEFFDNGVASTKAIVFHHGTPSDGSLWLSWLEDAGRRGVRAVTTSRAGYGESSRRPRRRVVDVNDDMAALLASLGVKEFVAAGWSGGGPHALANAFLPGCRGVISLAGVACYGSADLDFLAGMGPENHAEFGAAVGGETSVRDWLGANAEGLRHVTGGQIREAFGGLVGPADRAVLEGQFADDMAAVMRRALERGFDGWVDDDLAFVAPWGFELQEIRVPVMVWQGAEDLMVPQAHARWLSGRLPTGHLKFVEGHGHISLVTAYRSQILDEAAQLLG